MEKQPINTVYLVIHLIEESEEELKMAEEAEHTDNIWYVYFREDDAKKEAKRLNELFKTKEYTMNGKIYYTKFVVIEKTII